MKNNIGHLGDLIFNKETTVDYLIQMIRDYENTLITIAEETGTPYARTAQDVLDKYKTKDKN